MIALPNFFFCLLTEPSGTLTRVQLDLNLLRPPRDNVEAIEDTTVISKPRSSSVCRFRLWVF